MSNELQTDDPTAQEWVVHPSESTGSTAGSATDAPAPLDDLDDEDWEEAAPPRALRLRLVTAALLTLGLLAGGFWIGAVVQRHDGTPASATAGGRAGFAAREGAAGGFTGGGFGAGGTAAGGAATAGVTRGTAISIEGTTLELSDTAGNVVKVTIGPSTTVSRTGDGAPGTLSVGDTVTVRGTTGAGGVVTASSVTAVAQGVTVTGGGFGGGGGGGVGGGFGGGSTSGG